MKGAGLLVAAMLAIGCGCARSDWIERTLVTSDVTGVWEGVVFQESAGKWTLDVQLVLQQEGAKVTGMLRLGQAFGQSGPRDEGIALEGTVNGDTFTFHEVRGPTMHGEFQVNGDVMTGGWTRVVTQRGSLHRQP